MWFWFSLIALICWSGSDLFSKIGCQDEKDKYSHLKMVTAVGIVMGLHAAYEIFFGGVEINLSIILTYLPVSALYIVSMAVGYLGLRYIELSISSPICNSSGAIVAVLTIITVGIGDERTVCVFGTAEGTFRPSTDPMEEIESAWYTRAQVRALHETNLFGSWALAYSWMFANGCLPGV